METNHVTTVDDVRQASSPQEAILVLAEALDRIEAKLDTNTAVTTTAWGEWHPVSEPPTAQAMSDSFWRQANAAASVDMPAPRADAALIADLENMVNACADPEEKRALEARLRLAKEDGIIPASSYVTEGTGDGLTQVDSDTVIVESPAPDGDRYAFRLQWATQNKLGDQFAPAMDVDEAAQAFAKGGPLWLYHGNDELVRQLPLVWRQMFVSDIERDSPRTAQEVARDILRADMDDAMGDAPTLGSLPGDLA